MNINNGIDLYNRGTQSMNTVVSAKLAKNQTGGLKYPHGNYPIEKYIIISVYDGTLAKSLNQLTESTSKLTGMLQGKIGDAGSAIGEIAKDVQGALKKTDTVTHIKKQAAAQVKKGKALIQSDAPEDSTSTPSTPSNPPSAPTKQNGFGNLGDALWSGLSEGIPMLGDALTKLGKGAFQDILATAKSGNFGNGSAVNPDGKDKDFVTNIYLPLPNQIQEALSHSYDEAPGWAGDIKETDFLNKPVDLLFSGAALVAKMTGSRSVTFDRNRVSMYSNSAFRNILLSWDLVPNNQEETKAIQKIIKTLKKYSSPESVSGKLLLKSPHFFRLKFANKMIDESLQFYEVVITDVTVDYSPGGGMEMNHDDTPKSISLSVTFKDREPKLMDDWDKGVPTAVQGQKAVCNSGPAPKTPPATGQGSTGSPSTPTPADPAVKTTPGSSTDKKASAGGGADAKNNAGIPQAPKPKPIPTPAPDDNWRNGDNDLPNPKVDWENENLPKSNPVQDIYNDSMNNPLQDIVDYNEKLPSEEIYEPVSPYPDYKGSGEYIGA